jgi:hypothetical protein
VSASPSGAWPALIVQVNGGDPEYADNVVVVYGEPTVPSGNADPVIIVNPEGGLIFNVKSFVVERPFESTTKKVIGKVPIALGVPANTPLTS